MHLFDYVPKTEFTKMVADGYIGLQTHPTIPLTIANYTHKATIDRVWNESTLKCRGLIYTNGSVQTVIARPFPKFFNLGEPNGVKLSDLLTLEEQGYRLNVKEKLDGSLGIIFAYDMPMPTGIPKQYVGVATRGSFTSPQAVWASDFLQRHVNKYPGFRYPAQYTTLVEIIYPQNRIVVNYGDYKGLVVLAMCNRTTEAELHHNQVRKIAREQLALPVVACYAGKSIATLSKETRTNFEGYVIEYNTGLDVTRAKVKLDEYCRLHKIITGWNAKSVWELLKSGQDYSEFLRGELPTHFTTWFKSAVTALTSRYIALESKAIAQYKITKADVLRSKPKPLRKDFALEFAKYEDLQHVFFNILDNKKYDVLLWDKIKPSATECFILDADVATEGADASDRNR